MTKKIKIILILGGGLIFILWVFAYTLLKISTANEEGYLKVPGLSDTVTIARDKKGIPRIMAKNEKDLFFAMGYTHASERLWQMFAMQQFSRGNLAEYFGRKVLPIDVYTRTLGLKILSKKYFSQQTKKMRDILTTYAAGVNFYIQSCSLLPLEFYLSGARPAAWEPYDSIGVLLVMLLPLSNNLNNEIAFLHLAKIALQHGIPVQEFARLYPAHFNQERSREEISKLAQIDFSRISITPKMINMMESPFLSNDKGSNSWATGPSKNRHKKSILANDTHMAITLPSPWYLSNLDSPDYNAMGFTVPGVPMVIIGYNGKISWSITMLELDGQDVFLEKLKHKGESSFYLYKNKWLPVSASREEFRIKGEKSIKKLIKFTRNGRLLNEALSHRSENLFLPASVFSEYGLALKSAMADGDDSLQAFYNLGKSTTIKEAQTALYKIHAGYFNFVIADPKNIYWQLVGKIPLREAGEGYFPSPAWEGKYQRKGYLPTNNNPSLYNPSDRFIVTANHRVLETLIKNKLPYKLTGVWHPIHRYTRIWEMLDQTSNIDIAFTQKLQMDQKTIALRGLQQLFSKEKKAIKLAISKLSKEEKTLAEKAYEILESFDGNSYKDSKDAILYYSFLDHFLIRTFSDEFGPLDSDSWRIFTRMFKKTQLPFQQLLFYTSQSKFFNNIKTPDRTETKIDMIILALKDALLDVHSRFSEDKDDWAWGALHYYLWEHSAAESAKFLGFYLNIGPFPAGGGDQTVNISSHALGMRNYKVYKIPSMRFVFDFSRSNHFFAILPTGQSGNPASQHYENMVDDYLSGVLYPLPFKSAEADAHYTKKLILESH